MAGAWTFTRPTPHPAPSSWPATYTNSCGGRWKRFMEMTTRRLRPRSHLRIGWWKRSSSTAPWPTTGSRRLRDCSSRPPTAARWATRLRRSPARPSPSAEPAFSSTDDATSRSRARSLGKSRAPIESISCARSCVTRGLRLFRSELEARARAGAQVRVIASVYTGSTERRALDALIALGARVKVSYEIARTRLHAKAASPATSTAAVHRSDP